MSLHEIKLPKMAWKEPRQTSIQNLFTYTNEVCIIQHFVVWALCLLLSLTWLILLNLHRIYEGSNLLKINVRYSWHEGFYWHGLKIVTLYMFKQDSNKSKTLGSINSNCFNSKVACSFYILVGLHET